MIRIVGRCFVVLLVACLAAFVIYWIAQNNPTIVGTGAALGEGHRGGFAGRSSGGFASQRLPIGDESATGLAEFRRLERTHVLDSGAGNLAGLVGLLQNIILIAAITAGVVAVQKVLGLIPGRRKVRSTES